MPHTGAGCALDAEFLFLLSLLRPLYAELPSELRGRARAWLQRLCWVPAVGDAARSHRNEYLCRLYMGMQREVVEGVFLEEPPDGPLRPPSEAFASGAADPTAWLDTVVQCGGEGGAVDERTYIATHTLPDGKGAFGYLAVSMARGEPHFVVRSSAAAEPSADAVSSDSSFSGTPLASSTPSRDPDLKLKEVLSGRPPPEQRRKLVELYDSLLEDVSQAEKDPDVPCPELDKLITSCQGLSVDSSDTSAQRKELLSQLKTRLRTRREQVSRRSDMLDSLDSQPEARPSRARFETVPEDEDSVWNIRPENVALLQAAYPGELVRRFLDGIVRERVAALGRVQARRYCQNNVNGLEEDAAEDMEHYGVAIGSWARLLEARAEEDCGGELPRAMERARTEALRCQDLAAETAGLIRQLDTARRDYFNSEELLRAEQEQLRAEIKVLRAEGAALQRRLDALQRKR